MGLVLAAAPASADVELTPIVTIDFTALGFDGSGFDPEPAAGQLDSDDWSVLLRPVEMGNPTAVLLDFGESEAAGTDYGRGLSMGGVDDPGVWAFDVDGAGLIALGWQPTDTRFTPGDVRLRLVNNTGADITEFQVEYTVWINNDEERSNSVILQQSADNMTYADVGEAVVSPEGSDANGFTATELTQVVTPEAAIADGSQYYIAWATADVEGDMNRDEFAIEGITIRLLNVCGNGLMEGEEECDAGLDNSDTGACTSTCTAAVCGDGFVQDGVEECDDGNTDPGDGCAADCTTEEPDTSSGSDTEADSTGADTSGADTSGSGSASATGATMTDATATNATTSATGGESDTDDDTGSGGEDDETSGCTCTSSGGSPVWGVLGLLGLGLARRRRR